MSNSNPVAGATFTLSASVRNDGNGASPATALRYYRSTDSTITSSDTAVGTDALGALAPAGASSESESLNAPSTPGTYYYGACVETVAGESDTTNNCSASVQVTVLETQPPVQATSDLETYGLEALTVGPTPGETFALSASVRNNGSGSSAATTLRYYQSTDASVTTSDTQVGTHQVPALAPSETSTQTLSLSAPSTPGMYYYGACVDSVTNESDSTNNCASAVQVTVFERQGPTSPLPLVRISGLTRVWWTSDMRR